MLIYKRMLSLDGNFACVYTDEDIILYYTSFSCQDGYAVIFQNKTYLFVDKRYYYSAVTKAKANVILLDGNALFEFLKANNVKTVGIAYPFTSVDFYQTLIGNDYKVIDVTSEYNKQSAVKTQTQLEKIIKAQEIAEKSFIETLSYIKVGLTEKQISAYLEYRFKVNGADGVSFEPIIAFNENSSVPHHQTGSATLKHNSIILMDFGCKVDGYCSDMTRMVAFGDVSSEFKNVYDAVLNAHLVAFKSVTCGMTGIEADAISRNYLKENGLDKYFTHSLGHGVGVKIHESPRLSIKSSDVLVDGNVFSIEPGVYIDGKFGVRIEDTVYLKNGKCVSTNTISKELFTVKP